MIGTLNDLKKSSCCAPPAAASVSLVAALLGNLLIGSSLI